MFAQIAVGEVYAPLVGREEGAFLTFDAAGILLCINYARPTSKEITAWGASSELEIRFCAVNDLFFLLAKAAGQNWIDAPLDPAYYLDLRPISDDASGYAMTVILTDAPSGIVRQLRLVGLGNRFSKQLCIAAHEAAMCAHDRYLERLNQVYQKYSTKDLVALSSIRYKTGGK